MRGIIMNENNFIKSDDDLMEEIAKKEQDMYEGLSKDELNNFVNSPENFKSYLNFKLDLIRLKIEKEEKERTVKAQEAEKERIFKAQEAEKERIFKAQEAEKIRQRNDDFWLNILTGVGVLCDYFTLTKRNNTNNSGNQNSKKD